MRCPGPERCSRDRDPVFPPKRGAGPRRHHARRNETDGATAGARGAAAAVPRTADAAAPGIFIRRTGSRIEAEHHLGRAGGLLLALDLHVRHHQPLDGVGDLGRILEADVETVALPLLQGSGKAHLVEPVVHDQLEALHLDELEEDPGDERKREIAVGDGGAEGRLAPGSLAVDVDPLVIPGRVGELLDGLEGHRLPVARAELLADERLEPRDAVDHGLVGHAACNIIVLMREDEEGATTGLVDPPGGAGSARDGRSANARSIQGRTAGVPGAGEAGPPMRWSVAAFPWEQTLIMGVAAVIGVYAGIAAGLFSNCIRTTQILLFRFPELTAHLRDPGWQARFFARLRAAPWRLEFAVLAAIALAASFALSLRSRRIVPAFEAARIRPVALAGAFGLALYYPLLVIATFNETFSEAENGLYGILVSTPIWLQIAGPALGGLAAGLIVRYVSPESGGHGVLEE